MIKSVFSDLYTNEELVSEQIEEYLMGFFKGREIKDKRGKSFEVFHIRCKYYESNFFSIDLVLKDYDADEYFLYYDETFEKNMKKIPRGISLEYSEQGLQGGDYVNLDASWGVNEV